MYNLYISFYIITEIKYDIYSQHRNLIYYFNKLMKQREEAVKSSLNNNQSVEQEAIEEMMAKAEQQFEDEYVEEYDHIGDQILHNNDIDNNTETPLNKITTSIKRLDIISLWYIFNFFLKTLIFQYCIIIIILQIVPANKSMLMIHFKLF